MSDSDDEIENSYMEDESFHTLKTPKVKNKTVAYVAESDDTSEDGDFSPEIVPNWRRCVKSNCNKSNDSSDSPIIGRKTKKCMVLQDSDSESSFVENNGVDIKNSVHQSDDGDDDEDHILVSAATRFSIMGVIPKDINSDESDFIHSDEDNMNSLKHGSAAGSVNSLTDLPDVSIKDDTVITSQQSKLNTCNDNDTSMISCSSIENSHEMSQDLTKHIELEAIEVSMCAQDENVDGNVLKEVQNIKDVQIDDEVTVIDTAPEVIAISSSDEDEPKLNNKTLKSPTSKKSPKIKLKNDKHNKENNEIVESVFQQYVMPSSYPNQKVVYVKKNVRDNELNKLEVLRQDLHNVKYLFENMDVKTLPDNGLKLQERLLKLEADIKNQAEKVAVMVVEPTNPTDADIAKDGFNDKTRKGFTWDDIQMASDGVQPRMFGKQAMATHMAERQMILERLRDLHSSLESRPPESKRAPQPSALKTTLMPYQQHALAWLQWRETQRPRGGILADDMGLGKTITMISLIIISRDKFEDQDDDSNERSWNSKENSKLVRGGTLVVCPASLLQQWSEEIKKHCKPHTLNVCLHHGSARATQPHRISSYDVVLTTYNILQRDLEKRGVLMKMRWRRVILDEAHIVRNHKSLTSMAVSALESDKRWCLTGTPVQNKDLDVFALLKFLRCTPFNDLLMWKKWIDNKTLGGQDRLSMIMSCLLLRRTKVQLQQKGQLDCLPNRDMLNIDVTLTKEEMNVYQKVLVFSKTLFAQFLHQRAEKHADMASGLLPKTNDAYSKMHKKMVALQGAKPVKSHEILVLLLRLRQVCCHCGLIAAMLNDDDADYVTEDAGSLDLLSELKKLSLEEEKQEKQQNGDTSQDENDLPEEGTTVTEAIRSVLSPSNPVFQLKTPSSKIKAIIKCLQENVFSKKGEKAVVVSQWTSVLKLVEQELRKIQVRSCTLTGEVPVPARAAVVDGFNDSQSKVQVMLLSLCAGGVGLNLCGGNHLLLVDPHWNPQLEEQAQDRIYRVGQKRDVRIYRFMCLDTVEQSIRKLQQAKLDLAESVLTGAKSTNKSKLSIEDLKMLFNMGSD
ncbi:Transcription termination factor 2 [Eumeta japonica]|uniref:Transcription termination factor 2 n=1 Tax=Eumeta variegata TaxID=151549 RepID=A0A4C1UEN9_EUMVA|nr:Transcription termination factor 2 [Eumeta japonica]